MAGNTTKFVQRLERRMKHASAEIDYEQAARLRDDIGALNHALEKSAVVLGDATDADVFALADDELEAAVQVFHVRGGSVRGQRGWVAEKDAESVPEIVEHLLLQVYGGESRGGRPSRGARPGAAARPDRSPAGSATCGAPRWTCGCRSAATSGR